MTRKDMILIASVLIIGISGMLAMRAMNSENSDKTAVVYIDNQEVKRIPIGEVENEKAISFEFGGNIGYLDIKEGAVRMKEMDLELCPEKICSDTGWISESYETIVCLPNRIAVNIDNGETIDGNSNTVDDVAF